MFKLIFVLTVAFLVTCHQADAYKIVTIQKGYSAAASGGSASTSAQPAFNPNALLQGVQGAIVGKLGTVQQAFGSKLSTIQGALAGKLSTVQSLLGRAVELKQAAKQNFLQAVTQKFSVASSGFSGLLAQKPLLVRKTVQVHVVRPTRTPAAPRPTATPGEAEPTTPPKPIGYRYGA